MVRILIMVASLCGPSRRSRPGSFLLYLTGGVFCSQPGKTKMRMLVSYWPLARDPSLRRWAIIAASAGYISPWTGASLPRRRCTTAGTMQRSLGLQAWLLASFVFVMTHGLPGTPMGESNGTIPGLLLILACFAAFEYFGKRGMWRALRFLMLAALVCSVAKFGFYSGVALVGGMRCLTGVANVPGVSAADVGGLHQTRSLGLPFFVTGGTQKSLRSKLNRFYGKEDYSYDEELVKNVKDAYPLCRDLLAYLTYNPVISVAKNVWNITDRQPGAQERRWGLAVVGLPGHDDPPPRRARRCFRRGAIRRPVSSTASSRISRSIGGFDDYQDQVEFYF